MFIYSVVSFIDFITFRMYMFAFIVLFIDSMYSRLEFKNGFKRGCAGHFGFDLNSLSCIC